VEEEPPQAERSTPEVSKDIEATQLLEPEADDNDESEESDAASPSEEGQGDVAAVETVMRSMEVSVENLEQAKKEQASKKEPAKEDRSIGSEEEINDGEKDDKETGEPEPLEEA